MAAFLPSWHHLNNLLTHVKLKKITLQHTCNFHPSMRGWFRDALTFPKIPLVWISLFIAPTSQNMTWANFLDSSKFPPFDVLHLKNWKHHIYISWKYKCIRSASFHVFNDFTKSFVSFELKSVGFLYMYIMYIATMNKQKNHPNCSVTYFLMIFFMTNKTGMTGVVFGLTIEIYIFNILYVLVISGGHIILNGYNNFL